MENKYVQFVDNLFIVILQRMLHKNSKVCLLVNVHETFTDEVIEFLLHKRFLC